jgi:outer membrane protein assembly factor BamB/ribosomal protein L7/L12
MSPNTPTSLNCPACGAPLDADGTRAVVRCKFCGNVSLVPGVLPAQAGGPASALDEIRQLAGSGSLADAIQRYQQIFGVDQQEAQQAVDALQAGRLVNPSAPGGRAPEELTKTLEDVQRLLSQGKKIDAIKLYREHFDVSLERAKDAVEQIEAGGTVQPDTGSQAADQPEQAGGSTRSGARWAGCFLIVVGALAAIGVMVFFLVRSGFFAAHYIPETPFALAPADNGSSPNVIGEFFDPNPDARFIGLVDSTTDKLVWKAAKLPGENADAVASGTDLIYAASGSSLLAYHKSDGTLAWQTQMPDKLNYGASTLLVTGGRVITDNADQSIQAYDAETGSPAWSTRLTGYDRTLRLMGSSLVVVDYTDNNNDYGLIFFDPVTGEKQRTLTPTCTSNEYTSNPDPDSGLVYDPAANALYLIFDSSYGCVQRIDLASGQTIWETDSQDGFSFAGNGFVSLMTDSTLYFSNSNDLLAVDKTSGKMKVLVNNPDYEMVPLALSGDKLIVRARRTRGTERFELWGVDAATGTPAWQMVTQGSSPIDPPDEMAGLIDDTGSGWTWKLTATGLVVMKFQAKPNQLVLQTFNPADGTSLGSQTIALGRVSGDFYDIPTIIGWQGDVAYINIDTNLYTLDLTTGKLKAIY